MFGRYLLKQAVSACGTKILLTDGEHLEDTAGYSRAFAEAGFAVEQYQDDLSFRISCGDRLDDPDLKLAVLAAPGVYIPYDIRRKLCEFPVSLQELFPRLNPGPLWNLDRQGLDLLCPVYAENYENLRSPEKTEQFIRQQVYSRENVQRHLDIEYAALTRAAEQVSGYRDWFPIAERKAALDVLAAQHEIPADTDLINGYFRDWLLQNFGKLSAELNPHTPVLVSRAMDYMQQHSSRFVIIVMDGMSEFDWQILSRSFSDIPYERAAAFAMIPTVTSISRQCLLSGKFPLQLEDPWHQTREKKEFTACAREMGFKDTQIGYERGYAAEFGPQVRCGAVIINDIDDMVHGQQQGRTGMYNDVSLLARQEKLRRMTQRFLEQGFDVYISADHGNTRCIGMGKLMTSGVETATKSHRMLVLKDIADKEKLQQKYGLVEFPEYYLMKDYDYLICDTGLSFDAKGEEVMSHGGLTIEEVIVPFIRIRA